MSSATACLVAPILLFFLPAAFAGAKKDAEKWLPWSFKHYEIVPDVISSVPEHWIHAKYWCAGGSCSRGPKGGTSIVYEDRYYTLEGEFTRLTPTLVGLPRS